MYGKYLDGLLTGVGVLRFSKPSDASDADRAGYFGEYRDNVRCGYGVCYYSNGDCYMGAFQDDRRHGWGVYQFCQKSGKPSRGGAWKGDKLVNEDMGQQARAAADVAMKTMQNAILRRQKCARS